MINKQKKIEEKILKIAIEIVREGKGALFIIGNKVERQRLFRQKFKPFSIFNAGADKVLKGLASIDGAVIIDKDGIVRDYGVMIKKTRVLIGHGTRHAAAITASKNDNTSILCSEEERKIKIFKNRRYVMQVDALQKGVENNVSGISRMLETIGAGVVGAIGVSTIAPSLGLTLIPGVLIFGGSYYALKKIIEKLRNIR